MGADSHWEANGMDEMVQGRSLGISSYLDAIGDVWVLSAADRWDVVCWMQKATIAGTRYGMNEMARSAFFGCRSLLGRNIRVQ